MNFINVFIFYFLSYHTYSKFVVSFLEPSKLGLLKRKSYLLKVYLNEIFMESPSWKYSIRCQSFLEPNKALFVYFFCFTDRYKNLRKIFYFWLWECRVYFGWMKFCGQALNVQIHFWQKTIYYFLYSLN